MTYRSAQQFRIEKFNTVIATCTCSYNGIQAITNLCSDKVQHISPHQLAGDILIQRTSARRTVSAHTDWDNYGLVCSKTWLLFPSVVRLYCGIVVSRVHEVGIHGHSLVHEVSYSHLLLYSLLDIFLCRQTMVPWNCLQTVFKTKLIMSKTSPMAQWEEIMHASISTNCEQ